MKSRTLASAALALVSTTAFASIDVQFGKDLQAAGFRKVLITPVKVEFDRAFLADARGVSSRRQRLTSTEVDRIGQDFGESFRKALADAFAARGFEVASAPSSDVLQIAPSIRDLHINAAEGSSVGIVKYYVREAGTATLAVEARDAGGERVLWASDQVTTARTTDFSRASDVSNRFWFETTFRRWADELASAVARSR